MIDSTIKDQRAMTMISLTANELKVKGVSAVEKLLEDSEEIAISVRGRNRYVMMDIDKYAKLREYELAAALREARADIAAGRFNTDTVAEHMKKVSTNVL